MMDRSFIRCVLVAFVVFAALQSILINGERTEFSDDCHGELEFCFYRATLRYAGLHGEESFAKARDTPFSAHCRDWTVAVACGRRQLSSGLCRNETPADIDNIINTINVVDLIVNYACKENFNRLSRIYRCVLDQAIFTDITDECKTVEFNASNACEKIPALVKCPAEVLASSCGSDAGNVATELGSKALTAIVEATYKLKCLSSKSDDLTTLVEKFLSRK